MPKPIMSIIVPVYNESETVERVVARCLEVDLPVEREIIVIDDGSRDGSTDVLRRLSSQIGPSVRFYAHESNAGKGAAVRSGIGLARGDWVVVQDADLEYDPAQLPMLLAPLLAGEAEAAFGSRFTPGSKWNSTLQRVANRFFAVLTRVLYGGSLRDIHTCYKVTRADLLPRMQLQGRRFELDPEITAKLFRLGARIAEIPITFNARSHDEGKKIGWADGFEAVEVLWRYRRWKPAERFVSELPSRAVPIEDLAAR